jgi:hypothetical protein
MNKARTFALTAALLFAIGINAEALAFSASPGSSPSYRSGFSSQRSSSPARSAPAPSKSFGGFGGARPAAPPAANRDQPSRSSALTRGLDQQASQDRALRTLDARRAPPSSTLPNTSPNLPAPSQQQAGMPMQVPMQAPQPIVIQQRSGLGDVVTGVLIGRAMSDNHPTVYAGGGGAHVDLGGDVDGTRSRGSFFGGVLRLFMWLIVFGAIGWAVYFALRAYKRAKQNRAPNYTFKGN